MSSEKLNVCVIFGGQSSEHEVSCVSAASVIRNLDREKYNITNLGITKEGEWYVYEGSVGQIQDDSWVQDIQHLKPAVISPSRAHKGILVMGGCGLQQISVDVAFPVLHGIYGEDGTIQGLFELAGIKYVGCGVLASSVGMNKIYSKMVFDYAGLVQAKWLAADTGDFVRMENLTERIEKNLGYPCFVKPANAGSSVGISKAGDRDGLVRALHAAAEHDRQIVIEEAVVGREVECAVIGDQAPEASGVGEIISGVEFYDYEEKYKTDTAKLVLSADLPADTIEKVRSNAIKAYKALDGAGLSRVDFFVRESDGEVVINEINTLPGFTAISMYPKLWEAAGLSYCQLLDRLIVLAQLRRK